MALKTFTRSIIVLPPGAAIYSDRATTVSVEDEAAGPFVAVEQEDSYSVNHIVIDITDWPQIKAAIDAQLEVCRQLAENEDADEDDGTAD